jgi:hypothetical protein
MFHLLLLVSLIQHIFSSEPIDRFWFSTKTNNFNTDTLKNIEFRGCYGPECVYIAPSPLQPLDQNLGIYDGSNKLWAIGSDDDLESINWVFSQIRPIETSQSQWISPVARGKLVPSYFDPTPYIGADDPLVQQFVDSISLNRIRNNVQHLANDFYTRNSLSTEAVDAAQYLLGVMTQYGCRNARLISFEDGYSPNVICEIPGYQSSAPAVFVGAHYDCRSTGLYDPAQRAPGADDNGSGSAGLLDILNTAASLIADYTLEFRRTIIFGLFSGEEQGLIGSGVYASEISRDNVQLIGMVGLDMIGYPQPNAPLTLYWMARSTNQNLTNLGIEVTQTYLGGTVTRTNACCSDQQSFYSEGYAAAAVAESLSYSNNPNYHRSTDTPDTLNWNHVFKNTQAAAALVATLAEPRAP